MTTKRYDDIINRLKAYRQPAAYTKNLRKEENNCEKICMGNRFDGAWGNGNVWFEWR